MALTIDECWLYVAVDENGDEGLMAFKNLAGEWMPLVCADPKRRESVHAMAEQVKAISGQDYKVKHFKLDQ